jgi:hypothetical protein
VARLRFRLVSRLMLKYHQLNIMRLSGLNVFDQHSLWPPALLGRALCGRGLIGRRPLWAHTPWAPPSVGATSVGATSWVQIVNHPYER